MLHPHTPGPRAPARFLTCFQRFRSPIICALVCLLFDIPASPSFGRLRSMSLLSQFQS